MLFFVVAEMLERYRAVVCCRVEIVVVVDVDVDDVVVVVGDVVVVADVVFEV